MLFYFLFYFISIFKQIKIFFLFYFIDVFYPFSIMDINMVIIIINLKYYSYYLNYYLNLF